MVLEEENKNWKPLKKNYLQMKTFQIKCKISRVDLEYLRNCSNEFCKYYNAMLNVLKDDFESKKNLEVKNYLSKYELQKQFAVKQLGVKPSYLMSWQIISVTDSLFNSIKGFYESRKIDKSVQFPKRYKNTRIVHPLYFSFQKNSCNIRIVNDSQIELSFQNKRKILVDCKYKSEKFKLSTLQISKEGHKLVYNPSKKCYFFHFCINLEPIQNEIVNKTIYIDLGQKSLVTGFVPETNEIVKVSGKYLKTPKLTKRKEKIQSLQDKKKKFSRKWRHLNRTIKRLQKRETNKKKTFLHRISKKLSTQFDTVVVGDLKRIKKQNKSEIKNINKYQNQFWPISLFVNMLQYKCNSISGNRFYKINESQTTKKCCSCNNLQEMTLGDRTYNCTSCGMSLERDTNSAINIYYKFLQLDPKLIQMSKPISIGALRTSVLEVS